MKVEKVKVRDDLYLIAVTDKKDNVVAAGAFAHQEEAETAANIIHTICVKQKTFQKAAPRKIDDLLKMLGEQARASSTF